jgi:hypothetical protein
MPERVRGLRGRVVREISGRGSKSERLAVVVKTDRGAFVLRRRGGPAYGDRRLERYVGKTVSCTGTILTHTLVAEEIHVVGDVAPEGEADPT